jgi:hypothetical protein
MSPGIDAVSKLTRLGFDFEVNGDRIRYRYEGPGEPDPDMVPQLLETMRAYKPDVLAYLSKSALPEQVLTCADCGFHQYSGPNPRQGWGHCTFKKMGCYGLRAACKEARGHQS